MSKEKYYVIKFGITDPYYIAKWNGDPGRTYNVHSALKFLSRSVVENAAKKVIKKYPERYNAQTHYEIEEMEAE